MPLSYYIYDIGFGLLITVIIIWFVERKGKNND
jgi:hypothetical protein